MSRILAFSGAGGGGGESSEQSVTQTPDNLRSKDTVEIILATGVGPNKGLVNGNRSVFIGETQLQNDDGTNNFDNFSVTFYPGDPEGVAQPVVPKLGGFGNSTNVNVALFHGTPVTRTGTTIVDPDTGAVPVDYLEVRFAIQRLMKATKEGSFEHEVQVKIEYKAESAQAWDSFYPEPVKIVGKTSSVYAKEYRKRVPRIAENYQIRVTKLTAENDNEHFADIIWESFQEINREPKTYPGTSLLHLVGQASDQFSSIPQISSIQDGLIVRVPSNYDPVAKTYTGIWDGSFKFAWTDNPAWLLYHLVMDDENGMNAYYPVNLDKGDVYEAAQWCDQRLPDGRCRYTLNMYVTDPRPGLEMIRYIAGVFNATFFDDQNGNAFLRVDKDDPASMLFAPENIIGDIEYSYTDVTSRYNDITVTFLNEDLTYTEDRRRVSKQEAITKHGRIPLDFIAVGCTNASEAVRRAWYKLLTSQTETEMVSFKTNRIARDLKPFDVFLLADPVMGYAMSGRVKTKVSATSVLLRDPIYLETGVTYTVQFQTPSGPVERTVAGGSGSVTSLTFTSALPADLPDHATFALAQEGGGYGLPKPYRALKIEEVDGDPDHFMVSGIEINRNKWSDADNMTDSGEIDYSFKDPDGVKPPTNLKVTEEIIPYSDRPRVNLVLTWARATSGMVRRYRVEMRRSTRETWRLWTETQDTEVMIEDVSEGNYDFRVMAVSINDVFSRPAEVSHLVKFEFYDDNLPRVTGLELDGQGNDTLFKGRDARFAWRVNYPSGYFDLGREPQGGDTAYKDPWFKEFVVTVWDIDKNTVAYTETVAQPNFVFSFDKNAGAFGTARRKFRVEVTYRNTLNKVSRPAKLTVENPPPSLPKNLQYDVGIGWVLVSFDNNDDPDFAGTIVWMAKDPTVDLVKGNEVYHGAGNNLSIAMDPNFNYYLRVAHYDAFGTDGLNVTDPAYIEGAYTIDTEPPAIPTDLAVTSEITDTGKVRLTATWKGGEEKDFDRFEVAIRVQGEADYQFSNADQPVKTWDVEPNKTYCVKVRARDLSANTSAYSAEVCVLSAKDSVPPGDITNLTATAGFKSAWLQFTPPTDLDYAYAQVWEGVLNITTGVVDYTLIARAVGDTFPRDGLEPGTTRYYKLAPVDTSGNIGTQTAPLAVTTAGLALTDFPADFGPIPLVNELPAAPPSAAIRFVFLTTATEQKLYRWNGTSWGPAFSFDELDGQITETHIADDAISAPKIKANAIEAGHLATNSVTAGKIQAGAITASKLAAENVITLSAQIADAIIDDAKIANLSAAKLKAGTALTSSLTVDGRALSNISGWADDPASRINTKSTQIDPGRISIYGGTTLSDWRNGPNSTEIRGGAIAANTISTNKLTVGNRGVAISGIDFQPNKANNTIYWSGGFIGYVNNSGDYVEQAINSGSSGGGYIFWVQGQSSLSSSVTARDATGDDRIHLATYHGGSKMIVTYGGTIIDGDRITTGTVTANQIAANAITTEKLEAGAVTAGKIAAGAVNADKIVANSVGRGHLALKAVGGAQIDNLSVDTLHIMGDAVTVPRTLTYFDTIVGNGSYQAAAVLEPFYLNEPGVVYVLFQGSHAYTGGAQAWGGSDQTHSIVISVDYNVQTTRGGDMRNDYPTVAWSGTLSAGSHRIGVGWQATDKVRLLHRTLIVIGAKK